MLKKVIIFLTYLGLIAKPLLSFGAFGEETKINNGSGSHDNACKTTIDRQQVQDPIYKDTMNEEIRNAGTVFTMFPDAIVYDADSNIKIRSIFKSINVIDSKDLQTIRNERYYSVLANTLPVVQTLEVLKFRSFGINLSASNIIAETEFTNYVIPFAASVLYKKPFMPSGTLNVLGKIFICTSFNKVSNIYVESFGDSNSLEKTIRANQFTSSLLQEFNGQFAQIITEKILNKYFEDENKVNLLLSMLAIYRNSQFVIPNKQSLK